MGKGNSGRTYKKKVKVKANKLVDREQLDEKDKWEMDVNPHDVMFDWR